MHFLMNLGSRDAMKVLFCSDVILKKLGSSVNVWKEGNIRSAE